MSASTNVFWGGRVAYPAGHGLAGAAAPKTSADARSLFGSAASALLPCYCSMMARLTDLRMRRRFRSEGFS